MALLRLRRDENVPGDFFVDSTCIDCDLCRQIAPATFAEAGEQSAVHRQPAGSEDVAQALKALVVCPTASIGDLAKHDARAAARGFPEEIEAGVYFCGFAAESSYGASSYLVVRPGGNVLVDSPRFNRGLAERVDRLGGVRWMFLTHRDDVADHDAWAARFAAERILHARDRRPGTAGVERWLWGDEPEDLAPDLVALPTPGHTPGHVVLVYRSRFLFSGDHLWWSPRFESLHASARVCWYSWTEQIRSMERLRGFDFEWVLPGHGRRVHLERAAIRAELERCIERMRRTAA
jgi:glyoxylase-like metal-dependent hydrolase (beta-lactamase superfamily II)/ferredoxin